MNNGLQGHRRGVLWSWPSAIWVRASVVDSVILCGLFCVHAKLPQSCLKLSLCDPTGCSPPGSSAHRISQARTLDWVAIFFPRGSSRPRDRTLVSCIGGQFLYLWATWEAPNLDFGVKLGKEASLRFAANWLCHVDKITFSQFSRSVVSLCDPMNRSTPGLPVHHQLPEFTQTHVHRVGDAIQPSHPLSSPSPPAPNPSQLQGLFQWVNCSHQVAKVLEFQLQHQSFQWTPRIDLLQDGLVESPSTPRDFQESSPTPRFKSINFSALSFLRSPTLTSIHDHWKNHSLDQTDLCWQSNVSAF